MKRLVIDVDMTLTDGRADNYAEMGVRQEVLDKLRWYKDAGFEIVLYSSRNMRTHKNNFGKIVARTVPVLVDWLERQKIPYDEIWVGKPWCGEEGFYVDDKAIRPDEFASLEYSEIRALLNIIPENA